MAVDVGAKSIRELENLYRTFPPIDTFISALLPPVASPIFPFPLVVNTRGMFEPPPAVVTLMAEFPDDPVIKNPLFGLPDASMPNTGFVAPFAPTLIAAVEDDVTVCVPEPSVPTPDTLLLSSTITPLFWMTLPVVLSNRARALSVEEDGPVTSPDPPPAGVAHVPSPRQKVEDDAPVPLFRFATGRLPVTPVDNGRPVAFVSVATEGVPRLGVTRVGEVAKTRLPLPVSFVMAVARLADDGVAKKVAMPVPRPDTPVEIGKPVAFVSVADDGVPRAGVVRVGDVPNTSAPVPVSPVTADARFALEGVPRNVATPDPRDVIPVPPFAAASVPDSVIVPDVVIGPPDVVSPVVPPDTATLVTVPLPPPVTAGHAE